MLLYLYIRRLMSCIFYLCILFSGVLCLDGVNKFCNSNVCNNSKQHTLCRFPSPGPARHCLDYEKTVKSERDKQALLDKINSRRNKVAAGELKSLPPAQDMLQMVWNEELEESAQRWADQCVTHRHSVGDVLDACRDLEAMKVGQNIATVYGEAPGLTVTSLIDVWYMELLNVNSSVISQYFSSNDTKSPSHKYFTQLVWAESFEVGCGGVKFKERFDEFDETKNKTVYRLVCNFAPRGNQIGKAVYTAGPTGSKCVYGVHQKHKALCKTKPSVAQKIVDHGKVRDLPNQAKYSNALAKSNDKDKAITIIDKNSTLKSEISTITESNTDDDSTNFDYFSYLYEFTKDKLTSPTSTTSLCKKDMAIDEILEFLKKKLSDDPALKEFFTTTLPISTCGNFKDESVAALLDRIYSKTTPVTVTETSNADFVNSTLLANLVEAVIFSNTDNVQATEKTQEIQLRPFHFANPVRVQPEVVETRPNYDITGHYFFPEDDIGETTKEITEPDYDLSYAPSMQDVVLEIEELRKKRPTRDFLYEILETESVVESTTKMNLLSPDDLNLHTSGYSNMKNFLKEISEKSQSNEEHFVNS